MRPHLLELRAFGPFVEAERVDFDELADAGLFLLHGDTGAGKTTLLDAISFALYGTVPGARGKSPRLRSDHAAPSVSPEVRLEFSVADRRWRVTRQPSWRRPKQRGPGTTEAKASVLLERWADGRWETVSTRFDEVGDEIKNIVGMTSDQFCQVVLLPQGGFAHFLHAGVDERADLLQRLFGTERFERVERGLKNRARELGEQLREEQQRLRDIAASIRQVAGPETCAGSDLVSNSDTAGPDRELDAPYARALLRGAQVDEERARFATDAAHADWGQRQDEYAALFARAEKATARQEVSATIEALRHEGPRVDTAALELRQARRAAALAPMVEASTAALAEMVGATSVNEEARAVLRLHRADAADAKPAVLAELAREAEQRVGSLEALRPTADELEQGIVRAREAEQRATTLHNAADTAEQRITALAGLIAAADGDVRAAQAAALNVEARRSALKELRRTEQRLTELAEANADVVRLSGHRDAAREVMQDVRDVFQERRQAYLDGLAARLAAQLSEGAPCPVCGGIDHPALAAPQENAVEEAELAESETTYETARRLLGNVERELAAAQQRVASTHEELTAAGQDDVSADTIASAVRDASASVTAMETIAGKLGLAETTLAAYRQESLCLQQELAEYRASCAAAQQAAVQELDRSAALRATLDEHLGSHPDFATAIAKHHAVAAALATAATAAAELARATTTAARAGKAGERAAQQAGFDDLETGAAALRSDAEIALLERTTTQHAEALAGARARLDDLPIDPLDLPNLAGAAAVSRTALSDAEAAFHQKLALQAVAEGRHNALVELVPELEQLLTEQAPRLAELETVRGLADLAAGDGANHRRMALSSYVLAARLEEVAAAASERLLRMTNGRYTLLHADTAPDARRRWGLGLRVRDAWTGEDRETGTLSGGETFLASLSLALGLADVVTAEAGGSRIETLFVDEGFGTLDENTLEDVLTVLDGLREGGRMVGLVSHVGELRQRIPTRLEVLKTPTGSTLRRPTARAA